MPKIESQLQPGGSVSFPAFLGERVYMREIRKGQLPDDLSRWQPTVDAMLDGIDFDGPAYLMVDQGEVKAGDTHRRGGWHVDGYWDPGLQAHSGGHTATPKRPPSHRPSHMPVRSPFHSSGAPSWAEATFEEPELLLLASDVIGCRAAVGTFETTMKDGGDCAGVDVSAMKIEELQANTVYKGNVALLHESVPLSQDTKRTVVRINIPGVTLH